MRDGKLIINLDGLATLMRGEEENTILNNLYLSLAIRKGSWWIDPEFGLDLPQGMKVTSATAADLRQRILKATAWIIRLGRARSIEVYTERDDINPGRINSAVRAVQADGREIQFSTFLEVL